jgi:signal transduction histidine kinase
MLFRARGWFARFTGTDWVRVDRLVGVGLLVAIELQVWLSPQIQQRVAVALAGVVLAAAVAVRRRWPLAAVLTACAALLVQGMLGGNMISQAQAADAAVVLLFYGSGAFLPAWRSRLALGVSAVIASIGLVADQGQSIASLPFSIGNAVLLPWALGRVAREHGARERRYREMAERLDAGRELHARTAAWGERARIARELHDVIAHSVSVMVIQTGGARLVMASDPERAEASLRSVERAGREALAEMRRLLGVLNSELDTRALAPQPGLADIDDLMSRARAAGLATDLRVVGQPGMLSPALDLCAYRIVQEALTNALEHAGQSRARFCIRWGHDALELEISDDGRGPAAVNGHGGGHGIAGMRERAALHGGSVDAGAGRDGGFTVRAHLPVATEHVR